MDRCALTVAAYDEDPETILAWACTESNDRETIIHYCYVREGMRRMGLAKKLLAPLLSHSNIVVTHWTDSAGKLPDGWKFSQWKSYR